MRIVYIGKSNYYQDLIRNSLQKLAEKDSIVFFNSYTDAEIFINNRICTEQLELDLFLIENNVENKRGSEFFKSITKDKTRTYSYSDFNFNSIPVVLIVDEDENRQAFTHFGFADVLNDLTPEKLHLFLPEIISAVKSWRKKVLDELDSLGIKFNSGNIDYTYFLSGERKNDVATNVLSENFKRFPRKLKYDWIESNKEQIEVAIDAFVKQLKIATRLNKKKEEKKFHKIFNEYPFLLKRDNYSQHWYEPRLHYNKKEYYEPDYGLKPNFNQRTDLSILEVKLPNEAFMRKTNFHPKPYSRIIDHIFQVNDYKDYLESDEYQSTIKKIFGFMPDTIEYNILIGRLEDKLTNLEKLSKSMHSINALHINFITYDELYDYQVKYLERMNILKIH